MGVLSMRFSQLFTTALQSFAASLWTDRPHGRIEKLLQCLGGLKKPAPTLTADTVLIQIGIDPSVFGNSKQNGCEIVVPFLAGPTLVRCLPA